MKTTIKIIVIDDNPEEILQQQKVFHQNGFDQVRYFNDPEEMLCFLDSAEDCEFSKMMVPDVDMQRVSGYELIKSLKRNSLYQGITILVSSTSTLSGYLYLFQRNYLLPGLG